MASANKTVDAALRKGDNVPNDFPAYRGGAQPVPVAALIKLSTDLEDSNLPFKDVVDWATLSPGI